MAVQQDRLIGGLQPGFERFELAGHSFAGQKFFKQHGLLADGLGLRPKVHH